MTVQRNGTAAFAALLDALEAEILGADAHLLHEALADTGRARGQACQEVRWLLDRAMMEADKGGSAPVPAPGAGRRASSVRPE